MPHRDSFCKLDTEQKLLSFAGTGREAGAMEMAMQASKYFEENTVRSSYQKSEFTI